MSLPATTVFEVRPGAGSATNGGGFVPGSSGTDWSQQNSPQYSVTDGVLIGTTTVTSASANFGTDVVGNVAYIAGSWYQIVSRTSATAIVVDRATGTASGQTIKIGGALDLCATAEPLLTAGMTLWIKATGTQTLTSSLATVNSGDVTSGPITWQGYHTTRGDHDGTRPLIATSTNNLKMIVDSASTTTRFRVFDNLELSSTAGTPGYAFVPAFNQSTSDWVISNCKISGCKAGILGDNSIAFACAHISLLNLEITGCVDAIVSANATRIDGCYFHGNTGYGLKITSNAGGIGGTSYRVSNSVFYSNLGGISVLSGAAATGTAGPILDISACAFVSHTNDGIANAVTNGDFSMLSLSNSIFYGNSGYGVNITNAAAMIVLNRNNAYGSNASGARNNLVAGSGDVTLSVDPFTARTTNDFTLNTTAGGGAACRAAGFPGSISGLVTAGSSDIGALQHGDPAASGVVLSSPRRICAVQTGRPQRRSVIVISAPGTPILMPSRRRDHPVYVPIRRSAPSMALFAHPVVLRSPIRTLARLHAIRRNAGQALFSQTANQTVLITSPRVVR